MLAEVATALAATDPDRSERIARSITSESYQVSALANPAKALAATDPDRARLSENPRIRVWQLRIVVAVLILVAFSILVSWQFGLTLAVIAVIADIIYRANRGNSAQRMARLTCECRKPAPPGQLLCGAPSARSCERCLAGRSGSGWRAMIFGLWA